MSLLIHWEVYQLIGDLQSSGGSSEHVVGWNHPRWSNILSLKHEAEEYDIYTDTEDGMIECKLYHSKKVLYHSKKKRASDEPETIYALCAVCKKGGCYHLNYYK